MAEGQNHSSERPCRVTASVTAFRQACVDQLAQELPEQQFNTWIKPLTARVTDDLCPGSRCRSCANRFKLDWIRAQYAGSIAAMAEKLVRPARACH